MFEYRALGGVELFDCSGPAPRELLLQSKQIAILTYLAGRPGGRPHSRDTLLRIFWPDTDQGHARAALRQAIYEMRRTLNGGVVHAERGDVVRLDSRQLRYDVWRFYESIETGDLARAVALRRGPLLDGFYVTGAPEFEQWLETERNGVERRYREALARLSRSLAEMSDVARALEYTYRWAREEPHAGRATCQLMQLLELTGDRAGALRAAELYAIRLKEDLGAEPEAEVLALAARIRNLPLSGHALTVQTAGVAGSPGYYSAAALPATVATPKTGSAPRSRPWRRLFVAGMLASAVLVLVATLKWLMIGSPLAQAPPRVALLPFQNMTGNATLDPLGHVIIRSIAAGLAELGTVDVIPLGERHMDVTFAVTGSYHRQGDSLEFFTEIVDRKRGRTLPAPAPVRAPLSDPLAAAVAARHRAMGALAYYTGVFGAAQRPERRPPAYRAYLAFNEGLRYMFQLEAHNAEAAFRRAIELDPTYTEAYMLLAGFSFYHQAGRATRRGGLWGRYDAMDSLAREMREAINPQTEADRFVLAWLEAAARGNLDAALAASVRLAEWLPAANFGIGFRGVWANQPRVAIAGLQRLDPDRGWTREWWWYWGMRTAALHQLQKYQEELRVAQEGQRRFPGNTLLLEAELRAMAALGDLDRVRDLNNDFPAINCLRLGLELRAHGHTRESNLLLTRVVDHAWNDPGNANGQTWAAVALLTQDRSDEAIPVLERLLQQDTLRLDFRGMLGTGYARRGDRALALQLSRELASVSEGYLLGLPTLWRARIAARLGDHAAAVDMLERAFAEGVVHMSVFPELGGSFWHTDPDFEPLWEHGSFQKLIAPR